jgi:hypothetical protein
MMRGRRRNLVVLFDVPYSLDYCVVPNAAAHGAVMIVATHVFLQHPRNRVPDAEVWGRAPPASAPDGTVMRRSLAARGYQLLLAQVALWR